MATIPAAPPKKTYVIISIEPPLTAPATRAMTAVSTIAVPASSRSATRIPTAAVGTMYGRLVRPAVSSSANEEKTSSSPIRMSTFERCQSSGRKRHSQASRRPTRRTEKSAQPASLAKSQRAVVRPNASICSRAWAVIRSPLRTIAWFWLTATTVGEIASAARSRAASVAAWSKPEFATSSGPTISAESLRSASFNPPRIRPASRVRTSARSASRSSLDSSWSRIRALSLRTASQRGGASDMRIARESSVRLGMAVSRRRVRSASEIEGSNALSTGATTRANASACWRATAEALSGVKSYCGSTALRAASRVCAVRMSLV